MTQQRTKVAASLSLLAVVAVWGATFPLVKNALRDCTPLLFNQLRMILAAVVLAVIHAKQWRQMNLRTVVIGAMAGVFLAAGYEFQTAGLALTTPSNSAFITGLIVVLVPLLCLVPALRPADMPARGGRAIMAAVVAFAGIVLLTVPALGTGGTKLFASVNRGDLLTLCCALAFAFHLLTLARASKTIPVAQIATLQIGFCALAMSVATPLMEHTAIRWTTPLVVTIAFCAVFATAAAFSIQSWAQQHLAPVQIALLFSLESVFAWIVAIAFFHDTLTGRSLAGAGLILGGILIAELGGPKAVDPAGATVA